MNHVLFQAGEILTGHPGSLSLAAERCRIDANGMGQADVQNREKTYPREVAVSGGDHRGEYRHLAGNAAFSS